MLFYYVIFIFYFVIIIQYKNKPFLGGNPNFDLKNFKFLF